MQKRNFIPNLFQKLFCLILLASVLCGSFSAAAQTQASDLEDLHKNRQCFELRNRVAEADRNTPDYLFYKGVVANRFDDLKTSTGLLQKFLRGSKASPEKIVEAYELLADNYSKSFQYGKSADFYRLLLDKYKDKITQEQAKSYENMFGLWNAVRNSKHLSVSIAKDNEVQGSRDKANLLNLPVEINNQKMDFVFDTGANLSTMTVSTANKLGLTIIESDVNVGSATDKTIKSKLAVVPQIVFGNVVAKNVLFLVFEDKSLFFPQINYQINGIIGFPLIKAVGKVTLTKDNRVIVAKKSVGEKAAPNMCLQGLMPLVTATFNDKPITFSFDTGARTSTFYPLFFRMNETDITKNYEAQKVRLGGAGGFHEVTAYNVKNLNLTVGNKTAQFPSVRVVSEPFNEGSRRYYGNLGQDLIRQFERMTLDFKAMQISFQ